MYSKMTSSSFDYTYNWCYTICTNIFTVNLMLFNHRTLSLIDNFNLVLPFNSTASYSLWTLPTFLSDCQNHLSVFNAYKPVPSTNMQTISRWSYFLTFKYPHPWFTILAAAILPCILIDDIHVILIRYAFLLLVGPLTNFCFEYH